MLALTVGAFVLCHALLRSRVGYYWHAIRENQEAAQALGINTVPLEDDRRRASARR